ncbi:MFS transporter [Streptomyces sp. HSW2009]|uniref:MFS transporter n=1 Tax=Streptomyces sp. HSW2009 TaxID=3142890 RepID=UPI0032EB1E29
MITLSLLLLVSQDYTYGFAGLSVSSSTLGQGVTAPFRGRLIDRHSPRPVLYIFLAAHLTVTGLLLIAVSNREPAAVVLALSGILGATVPPVAVMMRTVWRSVTDSEAIATAMALDSSMMGTALIIGPVLASWLSLSVSPTAPFVVTTIFTALSILVLPRVTTASNPSPAKRNWLGVLSSRSLRQILLAEGLFVASVTAVDVLLPLYAKEHNATAYTGIYLGALSIGSVAGSLALGAFPRWISRGPRASILLCVFATGVGLLALTTRFSAWAVLLVCPLAGLAIGGTFGTLRTLSGDLAPAGRVTETMSWLTTLDLAGGATGAALFTYLAAAHGSRTTLLLVPALLLLAAGIAWTARRQKAEKLDEENRHNTRVLGEAQ